MTSSGAAGSLPRSIPRQKFLTACAWGVHLYTALGAALGLLAIYAASQRELRASFLAMGVATIIDSSDGPLARWLMVKTRVPTFDGALLDNIVDYLTYTVAPVFLMLEAGIIPGSRWGLGLACFVMLASVYGFCRTQAKTEDNYFLGFPNYWNLVAFYLFCLSAGVFFNVAVLLLLAVMVFMPLKFIYPNRTVPLRPVTLTLGIIWAFMTVAAVLMLPAVNPILLWAGLSFIAYYFVASFALQARAALRSNRGRVDPNA
ncbi:CDP-alcohol phosphatidyltransferase family protein [Candidatus Binatus sp.]|uniref:CDP-alcohol phosphatidyltransferase family protein n=1 Tax=Candidatus Binatus sp. TaxID=2811406 RepID=UPI002F958EEB